MIIRNYEIEPLIEWLFEVELGGVDSRARTRFFKLISERVSEVDEERNDLIKKYCVKDSEGNPITKRDNQGKDTYQIEEENIKTYNEELIELLNEELVIDETEERKMVLTKVRDIILNTDQKFKGKSAIDYDRWCEIFEDVYI